MSTINTRAPKERKPGPYAADRTCAECGARLSRNNPLDLCAPCNGGDWGTEPTHGYESRDAFADLMAA